MKKQPLTIDEHATALRTYERQIQAELEDVEREIAERLAGLDLESQLSRRTLRDTDTTDEREARISLYRDGVTNGGLVYFHRGE